jgi:feruloyl esterase
MKRTFWFVIVTLCLLVAAFAVGSATSRIAAQATAPAATDPACEALMKLELPWATITETQFIINLPTEKKPGIIVYGPDWKSPKSAHGQASVPVPFCRVAGRITPTTTFEVWLPQAEDWNGRFNGVGNGALAGGINYPAMAGPLTKGYAVASTDGGHRSPSIVDGAWMQDNPELWDEFGYKAVHGMTRNAKDIVEAYYGKPADYSYFTGCSGGGQQALAEAQRYPADYDGIVAGAPANFPTRMWPGETWPGWVAAKYDTQLSLGGPPGPPVPTPKLLTLQAAVLAACDELDGVKDGLITDPTKCKFDPATLLCAENPPDANKCLTQAEVDTVKLVYDGLKDPTTGEQFWPGYEPGSEDQWAGHIYPFVIPLGYFKAMVTNNPDWDYKAFDFTSPKDFATLYDADARYAPILNATDPDLTAFNELGGKLILWHGWADQNIAPRNSINYYESVVKDVGDEAATQDFLRFFLVPGMGHCSGGPGPTSFNALAALEEWVEKGTAPEQIVGSHLTAGKVDLTRPLCVYPQQAQYKGSGDAADAASFECAVPK